MDRLRSFSPQPFPQYPAPGAINDDSPVNYDTPALANWQTDSEERSDGDEDMRSLPGSPRGAITFQNEADSQASFLSAIEPFYDKGLLERVATHEESTEATLHAYNMACWVDEGSDDERASRLIAADKILRCALDDHRELNLSRLHLSTLPPEIGILDLDKLDLSNNHLSSLPGYISGMTDLQTLNLANNHFSTVPDEIGALTNLQELNLKSNRLAGSLDALLPLDRLQILNLESNLLTSLPENIHHLARLETLSLRHNMLTSLPVNFEKLPVLSKLDLSGNRLTNGSLFLTNWKTMRALNLEGNNFQRFPGWLPMLRGLEVLSMSNTGLRTVPPEIKLMKSLTHLNLSFNHLNTVPQYLDRLPLQILDIKGNPFNNNNDPYQRRLSDQISPATRNTAATLLEMANDEMRDQRASFEQKLASGAEDTSSIEALSLRSPRMFNGNPV